MGKTYDFKEQLAKGQETEWRVAERFRKWYDVEEATKEQQRSGVDFYITDPKGKRMGVEVKADALTQKTGNVFMEAWSVLEKEKKGWVFTSTADILVYVVLPHDAYSMRMQDVRGLLSEWYKRYDEKHVKNKGYTTVGVPVPLERFAAACPLKFKI